ncbi:hypothetical protein BKI52_40980 [marine bacterium AO1-C]|nr:hypothetical protein BKI52_40980 [marine bacterium AO1-C]
MKKSSSTTLPLNAVIPTQKTRKYKEIRITQTSEVINVSAVTLWQIVSDFENVGQWTSTLKRSTGAGKPEFEGASVSERVCHTNIKGYDHIHEKLTMYNEANKELAYKVTKGLPRFVLLASNHWTVHEVGANQSIIKMEATTRLTRFMGFLFGSRMKKTALKALKTVLEELKVYAETGEVAEAKKVQMRKLRKSA